jgi:hypothetical protein
LRLLLNSTRWTVLAAAATLAMAVAVRAEDNIRTLANIGNAGQITGVAPEGLIIKLTSSGDNKTFAFAEMGRVESDRAPTLRATEMTYAATLKAKVPADMQKLEKAYKDIMASASNPPWMRVLCQWRLYPVYKDANRTAEALDAFIEISKSCPKAADTLKLPTPVDGAHEANAAMIKKIDSSAIPAVNQPYVTELKNFRVSLVMLEGSSNPNDMLAILTAQWNNKDDKVRQAARFKWVQLMVDQGHSTEAMPVIDELYRNPLADTALTPDVVYWHGRVLEEQKKGLEAAVDYMRIAILYPTKDKAMTADALWRTGQQLEAAKAPKAEVLKVYQEASKQYAGTDGAKRADRELVRLGQ